MNRREGGFHMFFKKLLFICPVAVCLFTGCQKRTDVSQVEALLNAQMAKVEKNQTAPAEQQQEVPAFGSPAQTVAAETVPANTAPAAQDEEEYVYDGTSPHITAHDGIDVDLTKLSSIMIYSEVFNMMMSPEAYEGKRIRMHGTLSTTTNPYNQKKYTMCVVKDALACCAQGLEFESDAQLPAMQDNQEITVTGTFNVYQEDGMFYMRLLHSVIQA